MSARHNDRFAVGRRFFLGSSALAAAGLLIDGKWTAARAQAVRGLSPSPSVETTAGRIRGYERDGVYGFRGVPYGASTAGANRFMPPKPATPWTGVRDTVELGTRSPQTEAHLVPEFGVMDRFEPAGEDCLVVNVWSQGLGDNRRRPVMVWLHGGGFSGGSNGFLCYDGANLARKHDVVVVGVNHRLNGFGFLYLAELGGARYKDSGNVGMLDVVAALGWVHDNIERFGGDPTRVTVFGQSGGGSKVSTLYGMPAAKGLFHRGIAMSGSQVRSTQADRATQTARNVLEKMNLGANQVDQLQQVSWRTLRDVFGQGVGGFGPVVDGGALPAHVFDPAASELSANVPLMIGSTETEVTWNTNQHYDHLTDAELREDLMHALRTDAAGADQVIAAYKKARPRATNLDIFLLADTDSSNFRLGTDLEAERKAAQNRAPVYKYYFQFYSPVRNGELRSMHTMDIPFGFENVEAARTLLGTGPDLQRLADRMSAAWTSFAATGDPNNSLIPEWPKFDMAQKATMVWNINTRVENNPHGELKALVASVANRTRGQAAPTND